MKKIELITSAIKSMFKAFVISLAIVNQVHFAYAQTSASILPPAKTTFFDVNGNPLTSGKVFSYIPNTLTPKTTWQDAAETIPNLNPVVLDAAGRALILGSGNYRQQVYDRNNNLQWDQVTSSTGGGGGTGPVATGDGDLVGTVKPWAGMTAPNQYVFAYGQEVSRTLFPALFTAITSNQPVFCNSGSPILLGIGDTTNFWIGMSLEVSCLGAGFSTVVSKTSTTVTMAANANVTTNTFATFFPWGRGNGTTTFNLPDFRGNVLAGNTAMGGTASTNLTSTFFGSKGPNSSGATGGNQSFTLAMANLPASPAPLSVVYQATINGGANNAVAVGSGAALTNINQGGGVIVQVFSGDKYAIIDSKTLTANTANLGSGTPASLIQPTVTTNYIIKVTPDSNSATASGVTSLGTMVGDIACGGGLSCTGNILSVVGSNPGDLIAFLNKNQVWSGIQAFNDGTLQLLGSGFGVINAAPVAPPANIVGFWFDSTSLRFHDISSTGVIGTTVVSDSGAANNFLTGINALGGISKAQPSLSNLSGWGTGVLTAAGNPLNAASGLVGFSGAFGTPTSITLTNATGLPVTTGISGLGTNVAVGLQNTVNAASGFVSFSGALGTPTSGVATNLTGTAAGLTAGNVTTNANLTGPVTSVGNTTTIGVNQVARNNEAQGLARSVIGNATNAAANVADIQGTANQALVVNGAGTALGFGTVAVAGGGTGDTGTAWTAYTPTMTCNGGTGTWSATGRSKTIGKTVFLSIAITLSAIGTCTASNLIVTFSLPFTAQSSVTMLVRETGVTGIAYQGYGAATATTIALASMAGGNVALATGDIFIGSAVYESQ